MKLLFAVAALALAVLAPVASAEVRPVGNAYDPRVRYVSYNADDVVTIVGHYGFSTAIQFAPGETVDGIALGDSLAWEVAPRANYVFVKPREQKPATNMTVVTNLRSYQFWLDARPGQTRGRSSEMYFAVKFRYPDEDRKVAQAAADRARTEAALKTSPAPQNWNYWACGAMRIRPTEAYDDGRFTYLRFPNAQEIPAAFYRDSDGQEKLANGTMRGEQLVLQLVAEKLVLRRGKSASCLENRSFNPYGVATPTGTTSPSVRRVVNPKSDEAPVLPVRPASDEDNTQEQAPSPLPLPLPPAAPAASGEAQ